MAVAGPVGQGPIWPVSSPFQGITDCVSGTDCSHLVWEHGFSFVILTVILAGGCAVMSGRSVSQSWQPVSQLMVYMVLLGLAVRFLHWGLFRGTLVSPYYYIVDTAVVILIAVASYRHKRASMMTGQYFWLFKRTGPFSWTRTGGEQPPDGSSTA